MNVIEQFIGLIEHIDYDYVLKNKSQNEKTGYAYERLIAEVLEKTGMTNLRNDSSFSFTRDIMREVRTEGNPEAASEIVPNNSFKLGPFGERSPVDLIIKYQNEVIALECKSTTGGIPEWNDNPPKPKFLYAFCIKGFKPMFKMGHEIISLENRMKLISLSAKIQEIGDVFNQNGTNDIDTTLNDIRDIYESGYRTDEFSFYVRRKFNQTKKSFEYMMDMDA